MGRKRHTDKQPESYKVSAIISAYYAAPYLLGRIENLLSQTLRPEIIVVCKRDSEEHKLVANAYGSTNGVIIATEEEDKVPTIYWAWNLGAAVATGVYLTNTNSDDRLNPDALERLAAVLDEDPDAGVVYADTQIIDGETGKPVGSYNWAEGDYETLLKGCFLSPAPMWRASLHKDYGYFDPEYKSAGDYDYWLRLAANGVKMVKLKNYVACKYLKRKDSAEHREKLLTVWETARARSAYAEIWAARSK